MADPVNSVSVEAGALVVTGALTQFVAAEGDLLVISGVTAVISSRTSSTALRLKKGWPGPKVTGSTAWEIVPTSPYWQSNVATSRKLTDLLARFDAGPIKWDAAGPLTDRSKYNGQPKDFVFLSYDPAPFTLYVKKTNENTNASWSAGQAIQGVAAESTQQAKTAADEAAASARLSLEQAGIATAGASTATTQAGISTTGAATSTTQAGISTTQAGVSVAARIAAQAAADVATAAQPGMVFDYPTLQAAKDAMIPAGKMFVRTAGLNTPGDGFGTIYTRSAASTVGPGGFQSKDGARWEPDVVALRLELLGAGAGNAGADLTAVQRARLMTALIRLDASLSNVTTTDLASYMDLAFRGTGKIDLYRKYVSGDVCLSAMPQIANDLSPLEQCPTSCRSQTVVEVLVGDSISTFFANTYARSCMLTSVLERTLREAASAAGKTFQFYNRSIAGQGFEALDSKPVISAGRVDWYTNLDTPWLDYIKALRPTRVFISLGMNHISGIKATTIRSIIAKIKAWGFGTDVVLLTNLVPRPYVGPLLPSSGPWNDRATQEGADRAAGLVRTLARLLGLGLIDIHRMCCRAVYGFDPTEGTIARVRDSVLISNGATGTKQAYGYSGRFRLDPTKLKSDGSTPIVFTTGPGTSDFLLLNLTATANAYQVIVLSGDGTDQIGVSGPTLISIPPPTDQAFELVFECIAGFGILYIQGLTFTAGYGDSNANLWSGKLVARGGLYTPKITCEAAGALSSFAFDYIEPTIVRPTVTGTMLFGVGDGTIERYAGSGYNHPGAYVESHIYAPMLRATRFYDGDPFRQPVARDLVILDSAGIERTFRFDGPGLTILNGFVRMLSGIRFDLNNNAPRMYQGANGAIGLAMGQATDTGYAEFRGAGGVGLALLNGGLSSGGNVFPSIDNVFSAGTAALRFSQIFAASNVISTSDANHKLDRSGGALVQDRVSPLTDAEIAWACALADEPGIYRWRESYAEKGDESRLHVGMTVQRAIALGRECGIENPMAYGFICFDQWEAQEEQVALFQEIEIGRNEKDEPIYEMEPTRPAIPGHPAGQRYGFRYEQLTLFIMAGQRAADRRARKSRAARKGAASRKARKVQKAA